MPTIHFARAIQRHVRCDPAAVKALVLADALAEVFAAVPQLRGYVLDDQGQVRQHIEVFVDGKAVRKPTDGHDTSLSADSQIYVMQALSGG